MSETGKRKRKISHLCDLMEVVLCPKVDGRFEIPCLDCTRNNTVQRKWHAHRKQWGPVEKNGVPIRKKQASEDRKLHQWSRHCQVLLQAVSVIGAHDVIRLAILRALCYTLGYSHKTWILRISRSSADAISVIRAGHYAVGVIPNIYSCANSVMNLAWTLLRFPRAWRR